MYTHHHLSLCVIHFSEMIQPIVQKKKKVIFSTLDSRLAEETVNDI